jgi:hypothetical protein
MKLVAFPNLYIRLGEGHTIPKLKEKKNSSELLRHHSVVFLTFSSSDILGLFYAFFFIEVFRIGLRM